MNLNIFKEAKPEQPAELFIYTEDQLMARLKFFIGICLALTLTGIVFVVLYSIIFVTQPLNAMSPIDQKFFELIVPIATFLTGTLSGIMLAGTKPEDKEAMLQAQKQAQENFAETKKVMSAPPRVEPTFTPPGAPVVTSGYVTTTTATSQPITGYGGKLAPPPAPQPEL